ncbi:hypothetical protein BH23PAT1_BH23PAT1_4570 [soil metagenome]
MKFKFDGYNYLLRLEKSELLTESLKNFGRQENIAGASVSGIGAAIWSELVPHKPSLYGSGHRLAAPATSSTPASYRLGTHPELPEPSVTTSRRRYLAEERGLKGYKVIII